MDKKKNPERKKSEMDKRGILMVSFGTSHLDTMAKTIEVLEKEVAEQYPENPVYCR